MRSISSLLKTECLTASKRIDKDRITRANRLASVLKTLCIKHKVGNTGYSSARLYYDPTIPKWLDNARRVGPLECPICQGKKEVPYFDESNILAGFMPKARCYECKGSGVLYFIYGTDSNWGESDSDAQRW